MGQQTLDSPTVDAEDHKYKPDGPDKAIDCTDNSCKPITMEQLQKDLGPEQFKKYQAHAASEATKNEYFHPDSDAGKMMNNFSIDGLKNGSTADARDASDKPNKSGKGDASQENDLFGGSRNGDTGKKQDAATDKTKEQAKVDDKPKSEWDKKIEASGAFTVDQAKDAYNAAAKEKDGIAIIIGSKDTPGSKELLEKLPELQKENPNLKFMYVDKDAVAQKLAENPNDKSMQGWDKWIKDSQKDCNGQPIDLAFTSVQSLKADAKGNIGPDKVTSTHWTADINAGLQDQGRYAADSTARNLANAKLDFSPTPEVQPTVKKETTPEVEPKKETEQKKETEKQEAEKKEAEKKPLDKADKTKEETPFLRDEKEVENNKAKEAEAAKEAQAAKDAEAAKEAQAAKDAQAAKEAQAREAAERKLEEQKPKEVDTRTVFKDGHVNEALAKAKAEGKPVIFEVGIAGTDGSNYCPPCRAFNAQMEPKLEQTFKDKAVVIKIDPTRDPAGANAIPGYPGRFPYSGAGYVDNQGKLQSVGGGMLGFAGADSWTRSINQRMEQAKEQIKRQQR